MRAYCPRCRTSFELPANTRPGTTAMCHACKKPFILSDRTVPGFKARSRPLFNLITLIVVAALAYGAYRYYPVVIGKPEGVVVDQSLRTTASKVLVDCEIENQGKRGGLIRVSPELTLADGTRKPLPTGSESKDLKKGEKTKFHFEWTLPPQEIQQVQGVEFKISGW